jgi:hypothetical protein
VTIDTFSWLLLAMIVIGLIWSWRGHDRQHIIVRIVAFFITLGLAIGVAFGVLWLPMELLGSTGVWIAVGTFLFFPAVAPMFTPWIERLLLRRLSRGDEKQNSER